MERQHGEATGSDAAHEFFALDCSVALLLSCDPAGPGLWLVSSLLRLCRRTRRLLWDFFRAPANEWTWATNARLWRDMGAACQRDNHANLKKCAGLTVVDMHPCFAPEGIDKAYRPVRLFASQRPPTASCQLYALRPCRRAHGGDYAFVGYQLEVVDRESVLCCWYLVADAILAAVDALMLEEHRRKWEVATNAHDYDLLLCAL
jgi:hypothetical protein